MKQFLSAAALSAAAAVATSALNAVDACGQPAPATQPNPAPAAAADVPVKAVVLFSSGVGYFQHFGTVAGGGTAELRFKSRQINDVLKSLVLQDLDGGNVTAITYPSQDPIEKTLRSFQVDITGNPALGDLLNQLRGARVRASVGAEQVEGTILGLEKKQKAVGDKGLVEVWVLNLLTDATLRSVELDNVQKIELENPQLQQELHKALAALAQARDQDKKPVTIRFAGRGERRVRLGYVVETPVWKTSYRLILGGAAAGGAGGEGALPPATQKDATGGKLQGWAIVENQTDNDWNDVELSLVSGRPISFIQDLYQPLYVPRPVVQPELYASLRPQTYEGGMDEAKPPQAFSNEGLVGGAVAPATPAPMAEAAPMMPAQQARKSVALPGSPAERPIDPAASVASVASAARIGELFQYTVGSVTLPRQRSAMIPIITDDVEVEKLSIYNQGVLPRNPLNGARVKNTTKKHLLQGPVTVLEDGSYAGDASIENLPPGQERLISFGVDLQVVVDATKNREESQVQTGRIDKGVLVVTRRMVFSQDYLAENKGEKDKTLIVEHPIRQGWHLVETDKPVETTPALYRFKGRVAAGKSSKLTVREEIVQGEQIAILPMDASQLEVYQSDGHIPRAVRDVLAKAASLKGAMVDTQRKIRERQQRLAQITAEQGRIRENIKTVTTNSAYATRLLAKLDEQETQIEKTQRELEEFNATLEKQKRELEDYLSIASIDLEGGK